mmetsp:Transcript_42349/g.122496  ORF Transcript_42349/g.122496 Transcript_42349/m.122496 type:complete len:387 (+) Transcript_42349:72-1232(+)
MASILRSLPFWPKGRKILVRGEVFEEADITADQKGHFERAASVFRRKDIAAEEVVPGRWYLFACYGCPWAHRAIIARQLLGLEEAVPLVPTDGWWPFTRGLPALATGGWRTSRPLPPGALANATPELRAHAEALPFYFWRLYVATDAECTGRVTVPVLWDSAKVAVVNNESADILGILNSAPFKALGRSRPVDLRPKHLEKEIDELNERIYEFNNGVYRCGFAGTTDAFLDARVKVFKAIGFLEERLSTRRFLMGDSLTECDVRCFTTLVRFDSAYYNAFRCNLGRIRGDFPNLQRYLSNLFEVEAFRESCRGMHYGYPLMYFMICRWQGRRLSNLLRLAEVTIFAILFALAPDTPTWRHALATCLCLPLRLLDRAVDPFPNAGWL